MSKLMLAVVHDLDADQVITALEEEGHLATRIRSSRGYLRGGNRPDLRGRPSGACPDRSMPSAIRASSAATLGSAPSAVETLANSRLRNAMTSRRTAFPLLDSRTRVARRSTSS